MYDSALLFFLYCVCVCQHFAVSHVFNHVIDSLKTENIEMENASDRVVILNDGVTLLT